jgi:choline dehydrogenase-like flavoprotein
MAKTMKSVDAVMVGMGWSGSIMARELTRAGLTVVGLERGADKSPRENFALPGIRDELKYRVRQDLMLDTSIETHTLRNTPSEQALPMRKWDVPPVGDGLGGAGAHWNGVTWRFSPSEFVLRSHLTQRYGGNAIPEEMTIQDWGITYDDLEPHYDHFERLCGTSGRAGNLRGEKVEGGNPFEGPRQNDYPNKPLIMSQAYVSRLIYDKAAKKVRGVVYVDRRSGEEIEQPADLVMLCAYPFNNTLLLLTAGIGTPYDPATGKGVVGKNYCHQTTSNVMMFVEDEINPWIGTGVSPAAIDDFQGDNFDHGGLGFFGGGFISPSVSGGRPIQVRATPPGTPRWGSAWKEATARWYTHSFPLNCHGISYAHRNNYLDLDPTYRDAIGRPLIRMTYNYFDNDYKMSAFLTEKAAGIARAANATIVGNPQPRRGNYGANNGGASHHTGGAIMGTDPTTSALNRYLQSWEASNLFVMGGAAFPQNAGHNPTGTIGALTYWSAHAITSQYLKAPGPLVAD